MLGEWSRRLAQLAPCRETANSRPRRGRRGLRCAVPPRHSMRCSPVGRRVPVHCTGVGSCAGAAAAARCTHPVARACRRIRRTDHRPSARPGARTDPHRAGCHEPTGFGRRCVRVAYQVASTTALSVSVPETRYLGRVERWCAAAAGGAAPPSSTDGWSRVGTGNTASWPSRVGPARADDLLPGVLCRTRVGTTCCKSARPGLVPTCLGTRTPLHRGGDRRRAGVGAAAGLAAALEVITADARVPFPMTGSPPRSFHDACTTFRGRVRTAAWLRSPRPATGGVLLGTDFQHPGRHPACRRHLQPRDPAVLPSRLTAPVSERGWSNGDGSVPRSR